MNYEYEYQVSPRVVLRQGDKFRVNGGPYYRSAEGKVPLASGRGAGPFTFIRVAVIRSRKTIEAFDKHGHFAPLHVEGRRSASVPGVVPRPYKVTSKLRATARKKDGEK